MTVKKKNHSGAIIKILKNGNSYNNKAFKNSLPEIYSLVIEILKVEF